MNIRSALKAVLLPVCLETTQRMREKVVAAELAASDVLTERARWAYKQLKPAFGPSSAEAAVRCMIVIAHGRDGLMKVKRFTEDEDSFPTLDPLTVVVFTAEHGGPFIVTSGTRKTVLGSNRVELQFNRDPSKPTEVAIASDLQVEQCIDTLNEFQVRTILSNTDVFAPILSSLLAPADEPAKEATSQNDAQSSP